jgi:hypothetical protein
MAPTAGWLAHSPLALRAGFFACFARSPSSFPFPPVFIRAKHYHEYDRELKTFSLYSSYASYPSSATGHCGCDTLYKTRTPPSRNKMLVRTVYERWVSCRAVDVGELCFFDLMRHRTSLSSATPRLATGQGTKYSYST